MTAKTMTRAALACALILTMAGCSALVDPSTGSRYQDADSADAGETVASGGGDAALTGDSDSGGSAAALPAGSAAAEKLDALKRDNARLRIRQAESDAKVDALSEQLAQEREEQQRFREMMETNFDLLEQSVARSLTESMGRGERDVSRETGAATAMPIGTPMETPTAQPCAAQAALTEESAPVRRLPPPTQAPAGTEPMTTWDEAGTTPMDNGTARAAAAEAPRDSRANALDTLQPTPPEWPSSAPIPAAMATAQDDSATLDDPDLITPAQPQILRAIPEAKPLYEKGFARFARGNYDASIRTYSDFLSRFGEDNHSDNAQFWIGESYFQLKQYEQAEAAYRQVLRRYEHRSTLEGFKTPDAIYRIAQIYLAREDTRRARYYFGNVTARFPDSTVGRKARRELDALRVNTAVGGRTAPGDDS